MFDLNVQNHNVHIHPVLELLLSSSRHVRDPSLIIAIITHRLPEPFTEVMPVAMGGLTGPKGRAQ